MRKQHCIKVVVFACTSLVPLLFLTSEHIGCLVRFSDTVEEKFEADVSCRSIKLGVSTISFQLAFVFCLFACNAILTAPEHALAASRVSTLSLSRIDLLQIVILGGCGSFGIFLYGTREEGPPDEGEDGAGSLQELGFYVIFLLWFFVGILAYLGNNKSGNGGGTEKEKELQRDSNLSLQEKVFNMSSSTKNMFGEKKNGEEGRGEMVDRVQIGGRKAWLGETILV